MGTLHCRVTHLKHNSLAESDGALGTVTLQNILDRLIRNIRTKVFG
jgi:hypothetical protein